MRKTVFAALAFTGFVASAIPVSSVHAQLSLDMTVVEPMTKATPDK